MKRNRRFLTQKTLAPVLPTLIVLALWALTAGRASAQNVFPRGAVLPIAGPASLNAAPPLNCSGSVGGFDLTIDKDHSSVSGSSVICNYVAKSQGKSQTISGFAVTVEYACGNETQAAWTSKTAQPYPPWDPQTTPRGRIGPQGGNSLLIREDGEVSGFAGTFAVAEKLFMLVDAQTIATVVLHTDVKHPDAPASGPAPAPDPAVLNLDAAQLKLVASVVAGAHHSIVKDLNCFPSDTMLHLDPIASVTPDEVYAGDKVEIEGVVWAKDENGQYPRNVAATLEISQGPRSYDARATTDAQGYFKVEYTPLDLTYKQVDIKATAVDSGRYQPGGHSIHLELKDRGTVELSLATDKAVYAPGEPVTVVGTVTSDGKPINAVVQVLSDALPQKGFSSTSGTFSFTFTPGQEPNRNLLGTFQNGLHTVSAKASATGFSDAIPTSATYLVEQPLACASLPVQVLKVVGSGNVVPIDPKSMFGGDSILAQLSRLRPNTKLTQGLKLQTSDGAGVTLRFEGEQGASATVAVNGSSTIRIETYCKDKNSGRIQVVLVVEGGGQIAVNKTTTGSIFSNLDLAVRTTAARVSSNHTRYFVGVAQDEATMVVALEDIAQVGMPDGSNRIDLPAGKRIVVRPGEKPDISKITDSTGRIDPGLESILDGSQPAGSPVSSQPNTAVAGMTIQAARRSVIAGDLVLVPVWLIKGANVANLNLQLTFDANVVRPEGSVIKGNLLDNTLFTPNSAQSGIIRVAFAQTTGIAGTGTVVNVPFRAAGKPGDRSPSI